MGKIIDITGQKFGRLTAMYPTHINGRFAWHCKCDCGNECDVNSSNLRAGKQQSCGCLKKDNGKARKKDLTGQKFGFLTVLTDTENRSCGAIIWKCQCDCGNICYVSTGNLTSGHTTSCGCRVKTSENFIDLTGQRFGRLVALKYIPGSRTKRAEWQCQCDCGNIVNIVTSSLLRANFTQSCGCLKSKGEQIILNLLKTNNINFEYQKTFDTCIFPDTKSKAVFDFYIDNRYIIEFDGIQHFEIIGWNNETNYQKIIYRDTFKNQWCKENNIPLIRIPYTHLSELTLNDLILEKSDFIWQSDEETLLNKK